MAGLAAAFRWARYVAWTLLVGGFAVLVAGAVSGRPWGPVAVVLIAAGYGAGVIAVLPIVGQTLHASASALAGLARRARDRRFTASR